MSMLEDGVGSLESVRGIPSTIWKSNTNDDDTDDLRSIGLKSVASKSAKNNDKEDMLSSSIRDHGENILWLAKLKADKSRKNR